MELKEVVNKNFLFRIIFFAVLFVLTDLTLTMAGPYLLVQVVIDLILGLATAFVFGLIFTRLYYRRLVRIAIGWLTLFIIQWFTTMVEGYLFTTMLTPPLLLAAVMFGLLISFLHALFIGFLFSPNITDMSLRIEIKSYFAQHPWYHWLWRFLLTSILYMVIYYSIGTLISPIVLPFYLDMGIGLTVPPVWVILVVEISRGFLYILALLPLLLSLAVDTKELYLLIAFALYLPSVAMFLPNPTFPVLLRIIHGLFEILVDSLLFAAIIILLLKPENKSQ
ncbi:MAG: hypothetical protein ACFFD8_11325 [Candidatus Thorarchaeota archaeon]